jgi:hypothetical protein
MDPDVFARFGTTIWDPFWTDKLNGFIIKDLSEVQSNSEEKEMSLPQVQDFHCGTCDLKLNSREEQILHYKSEQHRRKIKSKLKTINDSDSDSR